jgi:predicted PurR-regulated permease PerM
MTMENISAYLVGSLITALFLYALMRDSDYLKEITEGKPYLYAVALVMFLFFCAIGGILFYVYSAFVIEFFTPTYRTLK